MKKEKSVRKAERMKKIKATLKSLIVPCIILAIIGVAVAAIFIFKPVTEEQEIVRPNNNAGFEGDIVLENSELKMVMDPATTQFRVEVKDTGAVWYSNPEGGAEDPLAKDSERYNLQSTMIITYSTINGVDTPLNNYQYSVMNQIYEIDATDDAITILYSVGNVKPEYVFPAIIAQDRYEALMANLPEEGVRYMKDYFKLIDINNLKGGDAKRKDEYLANFPILEEGPCYMTFTTDSTKPYIMLKIQEWFELAGYTYQDYLLDKENDLRQSSDETPVFNVKVEYTLDGDQLVVRVPMEDIEYRSDYPLIGITMLPYFGAGSMEDEGFLFVPEGGGAIINFNNGRVSQPAYYANMYGWDMAQRHINDSVVHETGAYFNAFGVSHNDNAFLCTLEDGSSYAAIQADISGKLNSYNYVNSYYTICHREQYDVAGKYLGKMFVYEKKLPDEDLVQRYHFVDSGSYVDMAKAYGDYLDEKIGSDWTEVENADVPVAIEIVGAVDKKEQVLGVPVSRPWKLTTFSEAVDMLKELQEAGMDNISVKLSGWMNGGVKQTMLDNVKVISKLGGKKQLKKLIQYANENGIPLYLNGITQYAMQNKSFDGFSVFSDAARYVSNVKAELYEYSTIWFGQVTWEGVEPYYLLKAKLVDNMMKNLYSFADKYDANVAFQDVGCDLSADYTKKNVVSREASKQIQIAQLEKIQSSGMSVMTNMGNDYSLPYTDFITNMDLNGSGYTILDYSIPFYQIAIHGHLNYTGEALNLTQNYLDELLTSAEYGAGLQFSIMRADSGALQKTLYTQYFGADFAGWKDRIVDIYTRYENEMKGLYNQSITDHQILEDGVRVTTYEDGTKVYVNYTYNEYSGNGVTVPARDYRVVR